MKKTIWQFLLFVGLVGALTSCASMGTPREVLASEFEELREAKTIAVLGYNTSKGLDDRLLDNAIKSPLFELKLEIVDDRGVRFPVEGRVNTYDSNFLAAMKESAFTMVPKSAVLNSVAYKKIKGDPTSELSNVNVAKGYTVTYEFDNWMDNSNASVANRVPAGGKLVDLYKKTLEELGADLGIIVVEKPYVYTKNYALIPDQLIHKKESFFAVAVVTNYYIVRPSTGNQVLWNKTIQTISDNQYPLKGYTPDQRKEDEAFFLEQYDVISKQNNVQFIEWLNEAIK
ncbi:MAG TPA: hypothetical protein VJ861_07015 [Treponemataceae bacterium]|nr:hypothetical protein [Treponemataceae bacterium]